MFVTGLFAVALAGGVGDAFPCPDGWAACEVEGTRLAPGLTQDHEGLPTPAGSRVGWFDLQPTATFDPFQTTRVYVSAQGVAAPPPEKVPPAPVSVVRSPSKVVVPPKTPVAPIVRPAAVAPVAPAAVPAVTPAVPEVADLVPEVVESCELDSDLEGRASLGRLTEGERSCLLAQRDGAGSSQTDRSKASRALMVDAFGRGSRADQDALLSHHLERIDQSDPDLCLRHAMALGRQGRATDAIRWADTALENRTVWSGSTYTRKVATTYKLRAAMAQELWRAKAAVEGDREAADRAEAARALTKTYAREWLDYARSADLDDREALALCVSAAGNDAYCR